MGLPRRVLWAHLTMKRDFIGKNTKVRKRSSIVWEMVREENIEALHPDMKPFRLSGGNKGIACLTALYHSLLGS